MENIGFFKPKAHILKILGEELIKSPVMAIYELIKNSYDADASEVSVEFINPEYKDSCAIKIVDNGCGITEDILRNVWLEPGTDHRKPIDSKKNIRNVVLTPLYKRVPMGEKGIGRFAVHRIANKIKLITRPKLFSADNHNIADGSLEDYEIELEIDWDKFQQTKYLQDVKVSWIKRESNFFFKNESGTYIELSDVKEQWNRSMAIDLKTDTFSMLTPREINRSNFKVNLTFTNGWLKESPGIDEVIESAPYRFSALLDKNYNLTYEYSFKPKYSRLDARKSSKDYNIKKKLSEMILSRLRKAGHNDSFIDDYIERNIERKLIFGAIFFEINSFNLESVAIRETISSPKILKEILKRHHGIRVYKSDLRVYNYGEPGNDWLGLDIERVQRRSESISNNQNIGYVQIQSEDSICLIEKSNREGFIHNEAYEIFVDTIKFLIKEFRAERFDDHDRWMRNIKKISERDVGSDLKLLMEEIEGYAFIDSGTKATLKEKIKSIDNKIKEERDTLLMPAMLGMSASMAIHELEKLVPRMQDNINKKPIIFENLKGNIEELENYVGNLVEIIKRRGFKREPVELIINKIIDNYDYKLRKYRIQLESKIYEDGMNICCERRTILPALMNLLDNSIYWLYISRLEGDRFIYISALFSDGKKRIIVADNGNGFEDPLSKLVRPFFTRKPDGIGLGLYIVDQIMMSHGKLNAIVDDSIKKEYSIPKKYWNGAILELIFDKEQECKEEI